jgi:carboxymethylenebutenolidase
MAGQDITIKGADGTFSGYLAKPASGKGPGLVVIQEIFGVNQSMRKMTDAFAEAGFIALCPDLFWRIEPNIRITDKSEAEWKRAFELFNAFNVDKGIVDIDASIQTLRHMPGCSGKVGAVGYCLGGLLAYLTATRTDADASVSYYGVGIHDKLAEAEHIRTPLMLHIAEEDKFVDKSAQAKIKDHFKDHRRVSIHSYAGMDHAFARVDGVSYNAEAARLANQRSMAFLKEALA